MASKKPTPSAPDTAAPAPPRTDAPNPPDEQPQTAPALVLMVRAPGKEKGYPPRCLAHPAEVAHMRLYDWIIAPDAD